MFTSEYSVLECPPISNPFFMDRTAKWRCTNVESAPNCPRCASANTKFCYYNNYSLSQPRYFCKGCRRYWTKGGSLRNVPVGGGCRKSRRARASRPHPNHTDSALGSGGGPSPCNESESGACIDLAAVLAKYVGNEESFSPGASSGSSDNNNNNQWSCLEIDSQIEDVAMPDLIDRGDNQAVPGCCVQQEMDGQDFTYRDFNNGFEMQQCTTDDEMGVDVLWSEGTSVTDFGPEVQPVMQVQDFGLFSPDDEFRISANLADDNWTTFDMSAYEF